MSPNNRPIQLAGAPNFSDSSKRDPEPSVETVEEVPEIGATCEGVSAEIAQDLLDSGVEIIDNAYRVYQPLGHAWNARTGEIVEESDKATQKVYETVEKLTDPELCDPGRYNLKITGAADGTGFKFDMAPEDVKWYQNVAKTITEHGYLFLYDESADWLHESKSTIAAFMEIPDHSTDPKGHEKAFQEFKKKHRKAFTDSRGMFNFLKAGERSFIESGFMDQYYSSISALKENGYNYAKLGLPTVNINLVSFEAVHDDKRRYTEVEVTRMTDDEYDGWMSFENEEEEEELHAEEPPEADFFEPKLVE